MKNLTFFLIISGMIVIVILAGCGGDVSVPSDETGEKNEVKDKTTRQIIQDDSDTLPLLTIMIQLEQNMAALQAGIWREDYEMIKQAAMSIANHPKIPQKQVVRIKEILGSAEFKTFVQDDKIVHQTSSDIARAARDEDFTGVTKNTVKLLEGCVSCHQNHRRKIRQSPLWK